MQCNCNACHWQMQSTPSMNPFDSSDTHPSIHFSRARARASRGRRWQLSVQRHKLTKLCSCGSLPRDTRKGLEVFSLLYLNLQPFTAFLLFLLFLMLLLKLESKNMEKRLLSCRACFTTKAKSAILSQASEPKLPRRSVENRRSSGSLDSAPAAHAALPETRGFL